MWLWTKSQTACTRAQPGCGGAEELPGEVEHAVALAEAAGEQEDQRLVGQLLDRVLAGVGDHRVGQAAVADHRVGGDADTARRAR